MNRHELVCLLLKCPDNADVTNINGVNETEVEFVRCCTRDNHIYLYDREPASFEVEEQERGIKIIEIHRSANLVHTTYEEV